MRDESWHVTVMLIFAVAAIGFFVLIKNAHERSKCESLQKQNVKAYVADGLFTVECVVVQREVVTP